MLSQHYLFGFCPNVNFLSSVISIPVALFPLSGLSRCHMSSPAQTSSPTRPCHHLPGNDNNRSLPHRDILQRYYNHTENNSNRQVPLCFLPNYTHCNHLPAVKEDHHPFWLFLVLISALHIAFARPLHRRIHSMQRYKIPAHSLPVYKRKHYMKRYCSAMRYNYTLFPSVLRLLM